MMKYLKGTVQAISQKFVSRTCHPCNRGSNKPAATGPLRKGGPIDKLFSRTRQIL